MTPKKLHSKKPPTPKPEKSNPFRRSEPPWHARTFAGIDLRGMARDTIAGKFRPEQLADALAKFAPCFVRGDYVPTIDEGYQMILRVAHERRDEAPATPANELTLRVRVVNGRLEVVR